jgi:hypothetical protein
MHWILHDLKALVTASDRPLTNRQLWIAIIVGSLLLFCFCRFLRFMDPANPTGRQKSRDLDDTKAG